MKVQNITDVEGFFKVVDSCEGKVELVTGEGDRLNQNFPSMYLWLTFSLTERFRSWKLSLTRKKIQIS